MLQTPNFHQILPSDFRIMETYTSPPGSKLPESKVNMPSSSPLRYSLKSVGNSELYGPKITAKTDEMKENRSLSPISTHRRSTLTSKQRHLISLVRKCDYRSLNRLKHTISPLDASTRDSNGSPLLHLAAQKNVHVTALLLSLGAQIHATDREGNTALHAACKADKEETILHLVKFGASLERKNKEKLEPLDVATDRIRGNLGLKSVENKGPRLKVREVIQKLTPKRSERQIRGRFRVKKNMKGNVGVGESQTHPSPPLSQTQRPTPSLHSYSPLYPSPMRSGLHFQGEVL